MEKRNELDQLETKVCVNSVSNSSQDNSSLCFMIWRINIENANIAFFDQDFVQAEALYKRAINIAISVIDDHTVNKQSLSMLLVSFHNIADLYNRQSCLLEAKLALEAAFVNIQRKVSVVEPNSQAAVDLAWGLMKAKRQIIAFAKQNCFRQCTVSKAEPTVSPHNYSNYVH